MDKLPSDNSATGFATAPLTSTEARTLRDVVHSSKHTGRNYGSLAKSQLQPTFYISHKVEIDDTLQRLALKYSINTQEIKRINKLWSDAELRLLPYVYIPVNSTQLSTLQTIYPSLDILQNLPSLTGQHRQASITDDKTPSSMRSSDSSTSIPTTNTSSYHDYFSKIDQQIRQTKKSLQSLDVNRQDPNSQSNSNTNEINSNQTTMWNNERHKGIHHLSDNSAFVNITTQNSREKYISTALQRIQREKDNFDEL
ncbi:unnamed protein product [Adineta steineri]|uniref:LysM domain-containing protein n=1 Tax=Adineta steineri TaxID=433720 RepID=A0A814HB62_9BILA|nr:unnamed protein product [Adineta steineri]CAF1008419.1 unnamed protein product [Adineta steineri]CAF3511538.1 unnamed protein product [Adineta steineri]CAF3633222.1 unnamed protein product [Adineta steineri]